MSRARFALIVSFLALAGCDAAKEPYSRAAAAEAEGKLAEAQTLYAEVCAKAADSPLCGLSKKRIEALAVKEAVGALEAGDWTKAKDLFTKGKGAEATGVKIAAEISLEDEELKAGLAWEDTQKQEKGSARVGIEDLAKAHSAVAPKAREWLAKNGPALLLEDIKGACREGGKGSCVELGESMAEMYASSPEAAEAQKLVDAEYDRIRKKLRDCEALLVQRLEVYFKKARFDICMGENTSSEPEMACRNLLELPDQGELFSTGPIDRMFEQRLGELGDPGYVKRFRERYSHIESTGEHDFTTWDKRGDKKK